MRARPYMVIKFPFVGIGILVRERDSEISSRFDSEEKKYLDNAR